MEKQFQVINDALEASVAVLESKLAHWYWKPADARNLAEKAIPALSEIQHAYYELKKEVDCLNGELSWETDHRVDAERERDRLAKKLEEACS